MAPVPPKKPETPYEKFLAANPQIKRRITAFVKAETELRLAEQAANVKSNNAAFELRQKLEVQNKPFSWKDTDPESFDKANLEAYKNLTPKQKEELLAKAAQLKQSAEALYSKETLKEMQEYIEKHPDGKELLDAKVKENFGNLLLEQREIEEREAMLKEVYTRDLMHTFTFHMEDSTRGLGENTNKHYRGALIDIRDDMSVKGYLVAEKIKQTPGYKPTAEEQAYLDFNKAYRKARDASEAFHQRVAKAETTKELLELWREDKETPESKALAKAEGEFRLLLRPLMEQKGYTSDMQQKAINRAFRSMHGAHDVANRAAELNKKENPPTHIEHLEQQRLKELLKGGNGIMGMIDIKDTYTPKSGITGSLPRKPETHQV